MKIKTFTKFFLFIATAAIFSCSSSSDEDNGNNNGNGLTSITVTASNQYVDFGDEITFVVKTNQDNDVTSEATILVDGQAITGNAFTAAATGQYSITAEYQNLTSDAVNVTILPVIVSIEILAQETYNIGERIDFSVVAYDNDGNTTDVTGGSTYFINGGESFTGAKVVTDAVGTLEAYATFNGFTSDTKTVTVEDNATTPGSFTKRALIEDYTGTWCGWCPRVSYGIELVQEQSDRVAVVAVHVGDEMQNSYGSALVSTFNPTGSYPTAIVNRDTDWIYPEPNNVNQVTSLAQGTSSTGVSIISARKGSNISFMVNAGFGQNLSGAKLVILLLENGIVSDQENYTDYYGGEDVLNNFVHDHVLRYAFTNPLGNAIPGGESVSGNSYRMKFDYTIPSNVVSNPLRAEIVAMVVDSNNRLINVNKVNVGENSGF